MKMKIMTVKDLIEYIKKVGVATGSRAFGCEKSNSDYDYVLGITDFQNVKKRCVELEMSMKKSEYHKGFYIFDKDKKYNIILEREKYVELWSIATKVFQTILKEDPTTAVAKKIRNDKGYRIKLFEILRVVMKTGVR